MVREYLLGPTEELVRLASLHRGPSSRSTRRLVYLVSSFFPEASWCPSHNTLQGEINIGLDGVQVREGDVVQLKIIGVAGPNYISGLHY